MPSPRSLSLTLGALGANRFIGAPLTWGVRIGYDF